MSQYQDQSSEEDSSQEEYKEYCSQNDGMFEFKYYLIFY